MSNLPFQFRLSTALVLMLVASFFVHLNCEYRFFGGWGYGWPVLFYQPGRGPKFWDCADLSSAVVDLMVILMAESIVFLIVEGIQMGLEHVRRKRSEKDPKPATEGPDDAVGSD
ncbi:MAG: hypothetical protein KIS92_11570 [Planctomycetota bacterium]|nr:hypothetical protein [Planctomycetota bacterium]